MNTSGYIRGPWVKRYNKFGDYEVIDGLGRDITIIEGYDNDAAGDEGVYPLKERGKYERQ